MKINTTPGETYIVLSTGGCTVTTGAGKQIKKLAAGQDFFTAMTGDSILSDDNASVTVAKGEILAMLNTDSTGSDVQATLRFQPVTSQSALPATGESGVIYLVPNGETAPNQYTEWVWTGAAYEQLGDVSVDLAGYVKKTESSRITLVNGLQLGDNGTYGFDDNSGTLYSLAVKDWLILGEDGTSGVDLNGNGRLLTLSVMNELRIGGDYSLNSSGNGKLNQLNLSELKLGYNGYFLNDEGWGKLYNLSVMNNLCLPGGALIDSNGDGSLRSLSLMYTLYFGSSGKYLVDSSGNGSLWTLSVMNELLLGEKHSLNSSGSGKLNQITVSNVETLSLKSASQSPMSITGTMKWDYNDKDKADTSDFGHPLAVYADGMALGAGWAEVSYVKAMIEMETPVLKSPHGGPLSLMSSLGLYTFKNASGGTEVPTLSAPSIECGDLSARNIHTDYMEIPDVDIVAKSIQLAGGSLKFGVHVSEMVRCYISSGCNIEGPGWDKSFSDTYTKLGLGGGVVESLRTKIVDNSQIVIDTDFTEYFRAPRLRSYADVNDPWSNCVEITGAKLQVSGGSIYVGGGDARIEVTDMARLTIGEGSTISGPGWDAIVADIQAGAAAAAAAVEAEQESFTKLVFPPTGTATAEQDPSWITKKNILMETNGGQLNMTQLTATLAYAAQTPLAIAKRTLWLSTSPGTGDAVQWPANAIFPDDQTQDKIQQLNSNSTYWFDITYVGGSDTILIRKVCSWAATTGESGPTE